MYVIYYIHIIFQGDLVFNMLPYGTGTNVFGISNSSGEVYVKNAELLRADRKMEYMVRTEGS